MKILMHICCANCSIYPVKFMQQEGHSLTGLWFNPNIHPYEEYKLRLDSLKDFVAKCNVDMLYEEYEPLKFFKMFNNPETFSAPQRCGSCYRLRLEKTAKEAVKHGFDAFSTTLLISPYQDFEVISLIGNESADKYGVPFYLKDFRPHFREAMASSKKLGLYRQKYCGCVYSMKNGL